MVLLLFGFVGEGINHDCKPSLVPRSNYRSARSRHATTPKQLPPAAVISRQPSLPSPDWPDSPLPNSPLHYFKQATLKPMLDAISAIGPGFKGLNYHQLRVIEWVGPLNVVHIVTDNATNYVAAERLISQKHKHINWSPCAVHCLNLIFKDIGKMDHVAELVRHTSKVTIIVYNHVALLSWLGKRDGWIEILRPGATRFATTIIALNSLHDHKHDLQALVTSKFFLNSRYSKNNKSKVAGFIILDNIFWNDCLIVVNLMSPLMRLLHIVDCDERPLMGYVYEGMFYNKKRIYDPIDYACIDETDFWIVDGDQPTELDVEELENLLYEKGSIPINEVEGSSSHIDDKDGGGVAIKGLDVESFGFPDTYFQSPYSNFQNE
uniref:DUF659 domain-containing protein n=1 Tax=Vitis vinifera TaxID=29760 RepID=A5BFA4_VITVI|nr:hypothetical protein VITISV_022214 [Vitis vinifera]